MQAGEEFNITPYGTESMHVLRAEKGFIIVGQETDGSMTPGDLGMDWIRFKTIRILSDAARYFVPIAPGKAENSWLA